MMANGVSKTECEDFEEVKGDYQDGRDSAIDEVLTNGGTDGEAKAAKAEKANHALPLKQQLGLRLKSEEKEGQIAVLTKELNRAKRINLELHSQLRQFYENHAVIQLENRVKEKQKRIEELMLENRTLKNSERILAKEVDELHESKEQIPVKKRALEEDLRTCKERNKQLKEQYRAADEKCLKLHQQCCDLTVKNKELVRLAGNAIVSSSILSPRTCDEEKATVEGASSVIASQEEDITRLHQRVALLKKTQKADQAKYERLLKSSQDEIERTRSEMEEFHKQLLARERAARVQFLHMKKLKHALHELANTQQCNQRFQPFVANREMRMLSRSNGSRNNQAAQPTRKRQEPGKPGRWIHEALHHLRFVMPHETHDNCATKSPGDGKVDHQAGIPANCVRGALMPCPPSATIDLVREEGVRHDYSQCKGGLENNDAGTAPRTAENCDEVYEALS